MTEQESQIVECLARLLKKPVEDFDIHAPWDQFGMDSLFGLRLIGMLSELNGVEIDPMLLIDCASIRELAAQLPKCSGGEYEDIL